MLTKNAPIHKIFLKRSNENSNFKGKIGKKRRKSEFSGRFWRVVWMFARFLMNLLTTWRHFLTKFVVQHPTVLSQPKIIQKVNLQAPKNNSHTSCSFRSSLAELTAHSTMFFFRPTFFQSYLLVIRISIWEFCLNAGIFCQDNLEIFFRCSIEKCIQNSEKLRCVVKRPL